MAPRRGAMRIYRLPPLVDDADAAHWHLPFRFDLFVPRVEY
jgi:hypothetical protein